jgi:hypothetical protein
LELSIHRKILFDMMSTAGTPSASEVVLSYCMNPSDAQGPVFTAEDPQRYSRCVSAVSNIGLYSPPAKDTIFKLMVRE